MTKSPVFIALAASLCAFALGFGMGQAREPLRIVPLFATSETILGEAIAYPAGKAKLTGAVIAMAPGDETGWHTHNVPLAGIVMEGELTVDYGEKGKRTYRQGDALVETMATPHNGRNTGQGPMRLFAIYMGAEGVANATSVQPPASAVPQPGAQ